MVRKGRFIGQKKRHGLELCSHRSQANFWYFLCFYSCGGSILSTAHSILALRGFSTYGQGQQSQPRVWWGRGGPCAAFQRGSTKGKEFSAKTWCSRMVKLQGVVWNTAGWPGRCEKGQICSCCSREWLFGVWGRAAELGSAAPNNMRCR